MTTPRVALLIAAISLGGCQTGAYEPPAAHFAAYKLAEPTTDTVTVCHGYNCRYKSQIRVSDDDFNDIGEIFAREGDTPAGERRAMSEAVAYLERKAGAILGTENDEGGVLDNDSVGDPSKQDCVDEAATTTGYLVMLSKRGLVKHHTVVKPEVRGIFIDGRWQHFTAVVTEKGTNDAYAIDSWFRPNGQPAVVMTLDDWLNDYDGVEAKQLPKTG